jgi:phosphate transport system protein
MVATSVRSVFDRQLAKLQDDVLNLAAAVEHQLQEAIGALHGHDLEAARLVDTFDAQVNQLRYRIEEDAYTILALQQPNGRDMRRIVASVSITTNLERMGDHAAGIARLVDRMDGLTSPACLPVPAFTRMADLAATSLRDTMRALTNQDADLARDVARRDDQIDALHKETYDLLISTMTEDPASIECATLLLWVSHNLERYADRISNICERIVYVATGHLHKVRGDKMP